jgi:hypothetical protein
MHDFWLSVDLEWQWQTEDLFQISHETSSHCSSRPLHEQHRQQV